jgi:hypothetical protein
MIDGHIALAATGFVVAGKRGDPLQQRRFSGAVLANDDRNGPFEAQLEIVAQERQTVGIRRAIRDMRRIEPQPLQIRRRQVDGAFPSRAHGFKGPVPVQGLGSLHS